MMKPILAVASLLLLTLSSSLNGTVLFLEDFSSYELNDDGVQLTGTNGKWIRASAAQHINFVVRSMPGDSSTRAVWSNSDNTNPSSLPRLTTKEQFTLGTGLRIDFLLNSTSSTTGQYTRLGFVLPTPGNERSFDKESYLNIESNRLIFGGHTYIWEPGEFNPGQTYQFAAEYLPVAEGVRLRLYQDGILRIDVLSTTFSFTETDNMRLYMGFRNDGGAIDSYVGNIQVSSIPEVEHAMAILLVLVAGFVIWKRR